MTPHFFLVVAGSRTFDDYEYLCEMVDKAVKNKLDKHRIVIISGGARGADELGERYARERGFQQMIVPANWEALGKVAGPARNELMGMVTDAACLFWDGSSKGTAHMRSVMDTIGKPYRLFKYLEKKDGN